jgi:YqaJ-like viral recombinase domain
MPKIYFDVEQQSAAWFKLHAGVPTASHFSEIITPARMEMSASRKKYACRIIASRLLNWQPDSLDKIRHIEDGNRNEPFAAAQLELIREVETRRVGFVTTSDGRFGASPDRVVMRGDAIGISIELKCPTIPVQMEYLLGERLAQMEPKSREMEVYKCQRQGQLYVTDAEEAIFYSYNERMPACYVRSNRDDKFISALQPALDRFHAELEELTEIAQRLGTYQAFAEIAMPAEVEFAEGLRKAPMETAESLADFIEGDASGQLAWGG